MKRCLTLVFLLMSALAFVPALAQSGVMEKRAAKKEINRWVRQRTWAKGMPLRLHSTVNKDSFFVAYNRNPKLWDSAFAFLKYTNLDTLQPGRYPVAGDAVFAIVTDAASHNRDEVKWESHRNYIDLQSVIRGKELIGVADTARITVSKPYDPDVINYSGEGKYYVARPGELFLFFSNDAHRPTIKVPGYDTVKKIVVKIQTAKAY